MDKKLNDVLRGKEANYMLPFYWQHGDHTDTIPHEVERIYNSGCKAFCVESRPHKDFGGDGWWRDMDIIISEAKKYGMDVWILDDDHFPTGHANGAVKRHPELRPWQIGEEHLDVVDVAPGSSVLIRRVPNDENRLIAVYAYPRTGNEEELLPEPIDLSGNVDGRFLYIDRELKGCYRIYYIYQTREGAMSNEYIDMMNPESVRLLIDNVYEPHYSHYADEFGKTIKGFFSDEPRLGNTWFSEHACEYKFYENRIGLAGMAYPWNATEIPRRMSERLGYDPMPYIAALWSDMGKITADIRYAYMDAVSCLYRDSFTRQLGDWCRAHGVQYIGHIIEDNESHARMGCSAAHYFRSLDGQDMSGIDVVLHQIMPGMSHYIHTSSCAWNRCNTDFFDCTLAKLASSFAHINPQMNGRAMCEIFGAYGWAEGASCMRYLLDHMLVRGINRFVPHAFSPAFPDGDCPPHFGAGDVDPQYEAFTKLMEYGNSVVHLLEGAVHTADAAILYHGEAEWMNPIGSAMTTSKVARVLSDAHIDYDILPMDCFCGDGKASVYRAGVKDGELCVGREKYHCLVIPYAPEYPREFTAAIEKLEKKGLTVYRIGVDTEMNSLIGKMKKAFTPDIETAFDYPELRCCHYVRGNTHIYMFVNESSSVKVQADIRLGERGATNGKLFALDMLHDGKYLREVESCGDDFTLVLEPYQSVIWVSDNGIDDRFSGDVLPPANFDSSAECKMKIKVMYAEYDKADEWKTFAEDKTEKDIKEIYASLSRELKEFSGTVRYEITFDSSCLPEDADEIYLSLGYHGDCVKASMNGCELGIMINPPYRFSVSNMLEMGENTLEIDVKTTLVGALKDGLSSYMTIPPIGLDKIEFIWDPVLAAMIKMASGNFDIEF